MPKKITLAVKALLFLFLLSLSYLARAQKPVSGKIINSKDKLPVQGATILVKGTNSGTSTDVDGVFKLTVPNDNSILVVTAIGFERMEISTSGKTTIFPELNPSSGALNEIVVTGYTSQRKKDIIGAVSVVNVKDMQTTPASNLAVQLQGRAAGVTISSSGEPGAGAVVRIRGFASAGNNSPLYVIDGVQTTDPSKLNPNDVESIQVLKDATSASIYGTRASNGVIIVTTKQGKAGKPSLTYDGYAGQSIVTDKMKPDMLNTTEYMQYLQKTTVSTYIHPVFGKNGSFAIPDFYITSPGFKGGVSASDPKANPALYNIGAGNLYQISKTSPGTLWFDELTRPALLTSHQISASGGTDKATYAAGINYFNQQGTFIQTRFNRYSARVNTSFKPASFLKIGENLQVSYEDRLGGANRGEGDAWASAFRMVPYVPVYDIKGGFGGNGVGESGNGSSPIGNLIRQSDNTDKSYKILGNVYGEIPFTNYLTLRSSFGIDAGNQFVRNISKHTYERSENQGNTQLTEEGWYYTNWIWTNTLAFQKTLFRNHDVKVLVGTEALKGISRGVRAFGANFDFETSDFISLNTANAGSLSDRTISNYNVGRSSSFSLIGRVDYTFKGKYLFNATFRRDGSSKFGPQVRYANFPAFGVGWRLSEENFIRSNVTWLTDLKLRAGWGQMGSESNVTADNQFTTFTSTPPRTSYDINGTNTSSFQGYTQARQGNEFSKWETSETSNIGLDATILNGKLDFSLDVYQKDTKDLIVGQVRNGLEPQVTKPLINIGTMRNTGFDLTLNYKGKVSRDFNFDAGITFSHYKNTMTKLNDEGAPRVIGLERLSGVLRTDKGHPISSFYGYVIDGFYNTAADTVGAMMPSATIGSWKFKDLNGDKKINADDQTFLGSPHPDFQMGFNLGATYKNFSFNAFFFWNHGNQIFNYTKYYTDMRVFVGGVSTRVLYDSWTPTNTNAKLPALGVGSSNGLTSFTQGASSSYYVEDGSYFRAKTLQLGYTLPKSLVSRVKLSSVKVYIQAQNLFTITKYQGSDPDIQLISRDPFGAGDYYLGVDLGGFPNPKQFIAGLSVSF
ncbi:MAG TPA: TonB-dependent receptor [Chitinophagaceae bacterium]|nr:TonB-dependent receptor [Chitinophagaceae bacterium]